MTEMKIFTTVGTHSVADNKPKPHKPVVPDSNSVEGGKLFSQARQTSFPRALKYAVRAGRHTYAVSQ
jgi:hypothetical protein